MRSSRLAEICSLITDGTHYTPPNVDSGVPFLTVKNINTQGALDFEGCSKISAVEYEKAVAGNSSPIIGDVLFSKDGTVGKVSVVRDHTDFAVLSSIAILRPNAMLVDSKYLGYALQSPDALDQALKKKTGSAIRRIILSDLKNVEIPLPTLPEQRRIAAILDKADALRAKRREAIAKLEQLMQSVFLEMFGDPMTNPKGWPASTLGELAEFENGDRSSNYPSKGDIVSDGILFLSTKNITDQRLDLRDTQFITEEKFKSLSRGKIQKGDLVITLRGTLGACCIFDGVYDVAFINAQMMIMRPRLGINSVFLHALITSAAIQDKIQGSFTGAAVPQLTSGGIAQLGLYRPPTNLQIRFSEIAQMLQAHKRELSRSSSLVEDLFQSLQQKGFSDR